MRHAARQYGRHGERQRGIALAMAMLFLLVLTVLGLTGMRAARQDLLAAGNQRLQDVALGNAEYVLAVAEQAVLRLAASPFRPDSAGDHYYPAGTLDFDPATPGSVDHPADRVWRFSHASVQLPDLDSNGVADDGSGSYIVEDAGQLTLPGEDASVDGTLRPLPGARLQAFRITVQATPARGARRSVQALFIREPLR